MHSTIRADDGDELSVSTCSLSEAQGVVRIELDNRCHSDQGDFDWITLSSEQARDLARALLQAAGLADGTLTPDAWNQIPA
jgi:hypothetical protein